MESIEARKDRNRKSYRTSNNLVDIEVQSLFLPLNLMQCILFCPKFTIKENRIKPNGLLSKLVALLGVITLIFAFCYRNHRLYSDVAIRKNVQTMYIGACFDIIFYCSGFIMNYVVSVLQSNRNVDVVLKIQEIHRLLNSKRYYRRFVIFNWISVILVFKVYILVLIYICVKLKLHNYDIFCGLALCCFDINIVYATRIITLLRDKVDLWNIRVKDLQKAFDSEDHCKKMFQAYSNILKCYELYKNSFQHMIVFHTTGFFCHALIKLQITIELFKLAGQNRHDVEVCFTIISLYIWVAKSLMFQILLSWQTEKFYKSIHNVQDSCAIIFKTSFTDHEKRLCKNINRLHRAIFNKINACGIFHVDAILPLKLTELITSYVVVLLQFAFL